MQIKPIAAALALLACQSAAYADTTSADTELDNIVVTATRVSQNPLKSLNDVSVITRSDIDNSNAQSLPELLQQTIGIETMSSGGSGTQSKLFLPVHFLPRPCRCCLKRQQVGCHGPGKILLSAVRPQYSFGPDGKGL